jgi:hypothetical protein
VVLSSGRDTVTREIAPIRCVAVRDVIKITGLHGHTPGVAAILDAFPSPSPSDYVGKAATLRKPDGRTSRTEVADVRDHGVTISLFFAGLGIEDVPIGTEITVDS